MLLKKEKIDVGKDHDVREKVKMEVRVPDSLPVIPTGGEEAAKMMSDINVLKDQLKREFEMKDFGAAKRILGMEIQKDRPIVRIGLLCLSLEDMSCEEIELSSTSSIFDNSSRPGLSKSKGKAIIMSEPVGEAIGEVETKGGTTTQLLRHRDTYCPQHGVAANQSVINVELGKMEYEVSKKDFKYNHAKVREAAAEMILVHEYPFSMMEHEFFNRFMRTATPYYESISRATAKSDVMATYEREKKSLKATFLSVSKVSLTSDFWKSGQKIGYMVLTVHFIDSDWKLQKKILNFCDVPPPHTGLVICEAITKCLDDCGIGNKVSTVTFDNATNNDAAIKYLKEDISLKRSLFFAWKIFHVRCCAHIINLMVQDGLSEVKHVIENVSLEFRQVFSRFSARDANYLWLLEVEDWRRAEEVYKFLEIFREVTDSISGTKYPIANMFLPEVWKIKEALNEKSREENSYKRGMAMKMKEKFDKYWGECNQLMAIAAVLDPRYKMTFIKFCFSKIYNEVESKKNIELVSGSLLEVYKEYVLNHALHCSSVTKEMNVVGGLIQGEGCTFFVDCMLDTLFGLCIGSITAYFVHD
ncbi:hypothetical protein RJ639_023818 [Escallonia herrerae]|uniref:hAT-like transposase RNase-H fold domain-containing protein n=1 Tax=Escallonia herrerae TaxID=1293975 RepID=A0AA88V1E7_9ASTE|nr:hypothetical protein RJ639_023818 [Escallonia herrerae]